MVPAVGASTHNQLVEAVSQRVRLFRVFPPGVWLQVDSREAVIGRAGAYGQIEDAVGRFEDYRLERRVALRCAAEQFLHGRFRKLTELTAGGILQVVKPFAAAGRVEVGAPLLNGDGGLSWAIP